MSNSAPTTTGLEATRRLGVEQTGIEIIDEADRTAQPRDLFWPWFAANVSVFGMSYAAFILYFGISFWQAVLVTVVGVIVSFLLCGVVAIASPGKPETADDRLRGVPSRPIETWRSIDFGRTSAKAS